MKRLLLTGMSGTGKSTVIGALAASGYKAIDLDYGWSETVPEGDWLWNEERVRELLTTEDSPVLFVCGCATNQGRFYPLFDQVILLSAPVDVIVERLRNRTNNPFGKTPEELATILSDLETFEPLLRRGATQEIDTSAPLTNVVEMVLRACAL